MQPFIYADRQGEIDGCACAFSDEMYLLAPDGRILGGRGGGEYWIGKNFFEVWPADEEEIDTFACFGSKVEHRFLLIRTKERTVLLQRSLFAATRAILAFLPSGEAAEQLNFPAALPSFLPDVSFSRGALRHYRALPKEGPHAAQNWVRSYQEVFWEETVCGNDSFAVHRAIAFTTASLAPIMGCEVFCDLQGLGSVVAENVRLDLLASALVALGFAAYRNAVDARLSMSAYCESEKSGVLQVSMIQNQREEMLPELALLRDAIRRLGGTLDYVRVPHMPDTLTVRFSICVQETQWQQLKTENICGKGSRQTDERPLPNASEHPDIAAMATHPKFDP